MRKHIVEIKSTNGSEQPLQSVLTPSFLLMDRTWSIKELLLNLDWFYKSVVLLNNRTLFSKQELANQLGTFQRSNNLKKNKYCIDLFDT